MLKFNSKGFIAVHVPTKSSFETMVDKAKEQGYKWKSEPVRNEDKNFYWSMHKIDTVLTFYEDGTIAYTNFDYAMSKNDEILPYSEDIELPKQQKIILLFSIPHIGRSDGTLLIWKDSESGKILLERGCSGKLNLNDFSQRVLKTHAPDGGLNDYGRRYLDIVKGLKAMYPDWAGEEPLGYIQCLSVSGEQGSYVHYDREKGYHILSENSSMGDKQLLFTWNEAKDHANAMRMTIVKKSDDGETQLLWRPIK